MPIVKVFLIEGRSDEVKKTPIEKITTAVVDSGCGPAEAVRVLIQELPSKQWGHRREDDQRTRAPISGHFDTKTVCSPSM